jgi:hypothetical protein
MTEHIPDEAMEAAVNAASPTMGYRASARRAVIAAAPLIRAPLEADARALARYLDWMLRGDWITVGIPPTGRPMERAELDALLARYEGSGR